MNQTGELGLRLGDWPLPGKTLVTAVIVMMSIGVGFALGQIIVHDIIPTFGAEKGHMTEETTHMDMDSQARGDLFADVPAQQKEASHFHETDEFIFALKFTHIHIFGMSAIFILMGFLVLFLDLSVKARVMLIALPFIGVVIDLASVWLKIFVHPGFF